MLRCPASPVQKANSHSPFLPRPNDPFVGQLRWFSIGPGRAGALRTLTTTTAASQSGGHSRDEVPSVSPSFIIPPPPRGSQYSSDFFSRDPPGGGSTGGGDHGARGGGGNRGGAFNFFNGGFFGRGGSFSLLHRMRLLLVFWAWCTFMALIVNSVVKLSLRAASSITLPALDDEASSDGGQEDSVVQAATGFMSRSDPEVHGNVTAPTDLGTAFGVLEGPSLEGVTASQHAGAAVSPSLSSEAIAAEAVEVRELDDDQRAYLQLLLKHSQAKASPEQQLSMAAWSAGIYVSILGGVAFLSVLK